MIDDGSPPGGRVPSGSVDGMPVACWLTGNCANVIGFDACTVKSPVDIRMMSLPRSRVMRSLGTVSVVWMTVPSYAATMRQYSGSDCATATCQPAAATTLERSGVLTATKLWPND